MTNLDQMDCLLETEIDDEQLTDISESTDEEKELDESNASPTNVATVKRIKVSKAVAANIRDKRNNAHEAGTRIKAISK